jgi:Ca-activated chloride channel family protein
MPDNFSFAYVWVFALLPLPLLIYFLLPVKRVRSDFLQIPSLPTAERVLGVKARQAALVKGRGLITWIGLYVIWILLIGALASPQLIGMPDMKVKTSRNFLIVADLSFSMANRDWQVDGQRSTRWEAVKTVMADFIAARQGDRMGLIFFASNAYIQVPFTPDLLTVKQMLDEADVGMAGQMTNIGKAIVKGAKMFDRDTIATKVMLILTDGVDSGLDILPLDAARQAADDSIMIYTIGIGNPGMANSDLDEPTLTAIAEMTQGRYFLAMDTDELATIYDELDALQPIEFEEERYRPRTLLFYYPLALAIFFSFIMAFFLTIHQQSQIDA